MKKPKVPTEELYKCYHVIRLLPGDMSRKTGYTFPAEVTICEDLKKAKKMAIKMSKWNFKPIYISKQVYDVNFHDEPVVAIRLKSGKKIEG